MKTVLLLLSTDRFSIPLIHYLAGEGKRYDWKIIIGSMFDQTFVDRIRGEKASSELTFINIVDFKQAEQAIRKSDLVIGMIPDVMLLKVADHCITHGKTLIAPSRLNRQFFSKKTQAEENEVLLLVECGFTPGLDHVTAKKIVDNIHAKGGQISSFKTYSGSLVDEGSLDNPWEFKLTERTSDVINFGKGNNRYLLNGQLQHVPYHQLFSRAEPITIDGLNNVLILPEEDALYNRKVYDVIEAQTVIKGRVLRRGFANIWDLIIKLGLTNTTSKIDLLENKSFVNYLRSFIPSTGELLETGLRKYARASDEDMEKLRWLGLFDNSWFENNNKEITPAAILQHLLEKKFAMHDEDRDCIVIRHELDYFCNNYNHKFSATLIVRGEDDRNSAMAKVIGLTTGAAAKAVLLGNIKLKGLHTPVKKEIYDPILNELEDLGIAFQVKESRTHETEVRETI